MRNKPNWTKLNRLNRSEKAKEETLQKITASLNNPEKATKRIAWQPTVLTIIALGLIAFLIRAEFLQDDPMQNTGSFLKDVSADSIDHLAMEPGNDNQTWLLERYTDSTLKIYEEDKINELLTLIIEENSIVEHDLDSEFHVLISKTNGDKKLILFEFQLDATYATIVGEADVYELAPDVGDRLLSWHSFWINRNYKRAEISEPDPENLGERMSNKEVNKIIIEDPEWLNRLQQKLEEELPVRADERMTRDRLHLNLEIEGMYSYRSDSYDIDIRDEYVLVSKNHTRQPIFRFNLELKELFEEVLNTKKP